MVLRIGIRGRHGVVKINKKLRKFGEEFYPFYSATAVKDAFSNCSISDEYS